ncbi:MAG: hypothetical protein HYX69_12820 [Planctomycetia bacterium]|nr:hypothetical protein [Planctomycetia bacterium]
MSQFALLKKAAAVLRHLNVPYMLTGSLASSLQGEPRATHDVDLVVAIPAEKLDALVAAFPPPDYYLSREAAETAVKQQSMFNLLDIREGDKVDFWLLTDDPFDVSRFARRQETDIDGDLISVSAPEDTILVKLRWSREVGGSERQFQDALGVFEVQRGSLDVAYLDQWIQTLGLTEDWQRLLAKAESEE